MLIVHKERLLHGLRGKGNERRSRLLKLRQDEIHGFHLPDAEWTPSSADEAKHKPAFGEQIGR